jgi:hypothetical protein
MISARVTYDGGHSSQVGTFYGENLMGVASAPVMLEEGVPRGRKVVYCPHTYGGLLMISARLTYDLGEVYI